MRKVFLSLSLICLLLGMAAFAGAADYGADQQH